MDQATVLARVNGQPITSLEVDEAIAAMGRKGESYQSPEGRRMVLEQLVAKKLFLVDAAKNLLEFDPAFKAEMKKVKEDMLANFAIGKAIDSVRVTDAEAKKFYEENKDDLVAGETVSASHILVDSEDKANEILSDIKAGKIGFEDAARQYSSCPSKEQGGNLGEFTRGQMVPEFDAACFEMEVGELRGPIKTQFGYHLIRLDGKHEAAAMAYEDIAEQIKQKLLQDKQQKAYQSKINQMKILYPVDIL